MLYSKINNNICEKKHNFQGCDATRIHMTQSRYLLAQKMKAFRNDRSYLCVANALAIVVHSSHLYCLTRRSTHNPECQTWPHQTGPPDTAGSKRTNLQNDAILCNEKRSKTPAVIWETKLGRSAARSPMTLTKSRKISVLLFSTIGYLFGSSFPDRIVSRLLSQVSLSLMIYQTSFPV